MKAANLIFPHQLFKEHALLNNGAAFILVEEWLFFKQYAFHKQKIAYHRATMKAFEAYLKGKGAQTRYIEANQAESDIRKLIPQLKEEGFTQLNIIDTTDDWLEQRCKKASKKAEIAINWKENLFFLNTKEELSGFFKPDSKKLFQTKFYIAQRKQRHILVDKSMEPIGGKWSFDADNRKKYPAKSTPPPVTYPDSTTHYQEALDYVQEHFSENPGSLSKQPLYPIDHKQAEDWLHRFLRNRFDLFGDYEDAIVKNESILHHSVLTPMLNIGLLLPQQIIDKALTFADENNTPLNSVEGFIRQIIGWREFIRGVYISKGTEERTRNFWGFSRKIPASFYDGTTGIVPIDQTIKKVLKTGYCHHIERLMILGNFMLLCEFDPDEVYKWFMELFIDAYDWVMVPNVYGMSQFADGGLMATKPYLSGSNYIIKMSDYPKGDWQQTWDALFWRFMHVNRDFFSKNPRLNMLLGTFGKWDKKKQKALIDKAEAYLSSLDQH